MNVTCPEGYRCVFEHQWSPEVYLPIVIGIGAIIAIVAILWIAVSYINRDRDR
jgi:hypothetical protein